MKINITATRLDLTPALKEYVEMKLGGLAKLLKRFEAKGELALFVEIARTTKHHKHGEVFYAEATLKLPGVPTLRIEEYDADARAAVDRVKDRLKLDIAKHKDRGVDRTRRLRG
ncbi:MAG: ribosome-associated translation inhibitor RaiA [bacterium]|nr:ribosome-associated translation inhibitor RaiA [bacterium]